MAAAKSYIQLHPDEKILVVDGQPSSGGTWAEHRLYPGLKSNNLYGSYEFPDFPMVEEVYGVKAGQHVPGATLHRYLTDFAKHFGIFERLRFNTKVDSVEPNSVGWLLKVTPTVGEQKQHSIETKKIILATGLTSEPNLPKYRGQETFTKPFFHAKDFCQRAETVKNSKNVVVVGGGKSACDVAYAFAEEGGAQVDLIIRPTGEGPVWLCPPYVTPLKKMTEELLNTRALTWFSPCAWGGEDGFGMARGFLHNSAVGRFMVHNFWHKLSSDVIEANGYNDHPELFKLKPWNSILWTGSGVGIHNYPTNLFELVKSGRIRVHIADIDELNGSTVQLSSGTKIETDVICCATGWKKDPSLSYLNFGEGGIGLNKTPEEKAKLNEEYDKKIFEMFPLLKEQPVLRSERSKDDPLRLYRFMVPPTLVEKRNIAFAGMVSTVSTAMFAAAQGLWISAFFDGKLDRLAKTEEEITSEVMLHTQWGKWRYPCGYGAKLPDFATDALPYVDLLLNDLGLKIHRKGSQVQEILEPYKPKDYKGLVEEWSAKKAGDSK